MMRKALVVVGAAVIAFGGAGVAFADSGANGSAIGSPGLLSGNVIQVPIDAPLGIAGNSLGVLGLLNPAYGGTFLNG